MRIIDRSTRIGLALGTLLATSGLAEAASPVKVPEDALPACFSEGITVFEDLPKSDFEHYYRMLKPGDVVESPFALPHAPLKGEPVPVQEFKRDTECVVFTWKGQPGGNGGMESRVWDTNGFQWKRIEMNPPRPAGYDTKPIRRGR
jgi:hypothetical protein